MREATLILASVVCSAAVAIAADVPPAKAPVHGESSPGYVLGPNDTIKIEVVELEEQSGKTYRVDSDGSVNVPLAGRVRVGGLTLSAAEMAITNALQKQINDPHVSLTLAEIHSQPVSVLGEVNQPGVHQIEGRRTLYDVLALAGGLKADAGYQIKITRRAECGRIPLPQAKEDSINQVSTAEIDSTKVQKADAGENIDLCANDIVSVPRAEMVYVVGDVRKPGGIALRQNDTISILEALSAAEGLSPTAAPKNARILRPGSEAGKRVEIPIDLSKVFNAKGEDIALRPDDVLFVPNNAPKKALAKAAEIALQTASGVVIFRR
jgi:polysaccharide export outer membrane protein